MIQCISRYSIYVGMVLCILGAKLWLIFHFGNYTPFGDQWDGIAGNILLPFTGGTWRFEDLFIHHNEHLIVFTRLFSLGLFALNGDWDPKLEMVTQALLHAVVIVFLILPWIKLLDGGRRLVLLFVATLLFAIPFSWENTLWGFQSQFYFVNLWGALGIWKVWKHDALTRWWFTGLVFLTFGMLSMAGGSLAVAATIPLLAIKLLLNSENRKREAIGFLLLVGLFAIGLKTIHHVPQHDALKASGINEVFHALFTMMSWPTLNAPAAILMQAPAVLLVIHLFKDRPATNNQVWLLAAFGIWAWLQMAAIAYGRGMNCIASRYSDIYVFCLILNLAAGLYLLGSQDRWLKFASRCAISFWMMQIIMSVLALSPMLDMDINAKLGASRIQEANLRSYLVNRDKVALLSKSKTELPFPSAEYIIELVENRGLANILASTLRRSVPAVSTVLTPGAFRTNGFYPSTATRHNLITYGSYDSIDGDRATGEARIVFPGAGHSRWIKISVAGYPLANGMQLTLTDSLGQTKPVHVSRTPKENWESVFLRVPAGNVTLTAIDNNSDTWFAFTAPQVIGPGTLIAGWLQKQAPAIVALGLGLMFFFAIQFPALNDIKNDRA